MRPRTAGALVAILLALGAVAAYSAVQEAGGSNELTEQWVSDPPPDLESNHHSPAAAHANGESYVAVPTNSRQATLCTLSVLDGNGTQRWRDTIPQDNCTIHAVSDPTVADFDRDERPEILAATSEKAVVAYDLRGREELRHDLTSFGYSKPLVANLTPAPGPETIVVDLLGGVFVLRPNGAEVWTRTLDDARVRQPAVRDFDADGDPELAVGQLSGRVVVFESDGSVDWRANFSDTITIRWMVPGQADDDEQVELAVSTYGGDVLAIDGADGTIEWRRQLDAKGATVYAFGDGDGDGQQEVYAAARDGKVRSLDAKNGSAEWTTTLTTEPVAPMPPPVLGDVDSDGTPELVAPSNTGSIAIIDPETGEIEATYEREVPINTFPRIADFDDDGDNEILVIYGDGRVVALSYA